MVELNQNTKYIILNNKSTSALYYYMPVGGQDVHADYIVTNTTTGEGYFTNVDLDGSAEGAIVTTGISNVAINSPRVGETATTISWEAKWNGTPSFSYPTFILSNSKVLLIDGGTSTLSTSESQSGGTGNLVWTPQQVYSSIKIKVEDRQFGEFAESSLFNVDNPLSFSISGPSSLDAGVEGTRTTSVSGGTFPYSYDWDYMLLCTSQAIEPRVEQCNTWNQGTGGTGTSWSHSLSGAQFDLKIRLTVSDSDNPHYTKKVYKTVDIIDV